jgi:hypothetical protein
MNELKLEHVEVRMTDKYMCSIYNAPPLTPMLKLNKLKPINLYSKIWKLQLITVSFSAPLVSILLDYHCMLLLIRRPRRVTGWVDRRHLHTRTQKVFHDVVTLRRWSRLPKAGSLWYSSCHESDLKSAFEPTCKPTCLPHFTIVLQNKASVLQPMAGADKLWCLTVYPRLVSH